MTIKEIKEANYLYNKHKEELELEYKNLCTINNDINFEEFENLEYKEMKEIVDLISYKCVPLIENKLKVIYESKRNKMYPELLNAIYYTELNNIDFLTNEQIKEVDNLLKNWRVGNYLNDSFQSKINLNENLYNSLIEFLYNNKIISKSYNFMCNECNENIMFMEENEYDNFNIPSEEDGNNAFFEIFCAECNYYQGIETKEQFENCNVKIIYKLIKKADKSMDEL